VDAQRILSAVKKAEASKLSRVLVGFRVLYILGDRPRSFCFEEQGSDEWRPTTFSHSAETTTFAFDSA